MPKYLVEVCAFDCRIKYMTDEEFSTWCEETEEENRRLPEECRIPTDDSNEWLFNTFEGAKQWAMECMTDEVKIRASFVEALVKSHYKEDYQGNVQKLDTEYGLKDGEIHFRRATISSTSRPSPSP